MIIDNFKIRDNNNKITINIKWDFYDFIMLIINGLSGIGLLYITIYTSYQLGYENFTIDLFFHSFLFIIGIGFGIGCSILFIKGISQLTNSFIIIDKTDELLNVKLAFFRNIVIPFIDIKSILLCGKNEMPNKYEVSDPHSYQRISATLYVELKSGKKILIYDFKTQNVISTNDKEIRETKNEVYTTSKILAKLIAKECITYYEWQELR